MSDKENFLFTHRYKIAFCFLLVLVIIDRCLVLQKFAFRFVDDDQSIMWFGAKEFGHGKFHEPLFFGQAYNSMLESFFAIPFLKIGIAYPIALPTVTSLLTLFPFLLLSIFLFRRGKKIQSLFVLSMLLLLPVEFGMLTSMPRGIVTGTFLAFLAIFSVLKQTKFQFIFFGFFSVLAVLANPNAVLVLLPMGILFLQENLRNKKFYFQTIAGIIPSAIIYYFAIHYYKIHPENIAHDSWPLQFNIKAITISSIVSYFNDVVPAFWGMGWMIFILLAALTFFLFRQKETKTAVALVFGILLLIFSLGINKVHDGLPTIFYSHSRMFVGIPLLLALFVSKLNFSKSPNRFVTLLLIIPVSFFIVKCTAISTLVNREVVEKKDHNVYVSTVENIQTICSKIQTVSTKYKIDLVVVGNHDTKHLVNYACPCLQDSFPATIEPNLDRRTWILKEEQGKIRNNILFVAVFDDLFAEQLKRDSAIIKVSADPPMYLLQNNHLKTSTLLDSLNLPMRPH